MKILRIFMDGTNTKKLEESVYRNYMDPTAEEKYLACYRGRLWEFVMYDTDPDKIYTWILHYGLARDQTQPPMQYVGPMTPKFIDCGCGTKHSEVGHDISRHSFYCDLITRDGWQEAEDEWKTNMQIFAELC